MRSPSKTHQRGPDSTEAQNVNNKKHSALDQPELTDKAQDKLLAQQITRSLDLANQALPDKIRQDITAARLSAQARAFNKNKRAIKLWKISLPATVTSLAVAFTVVQLVSYQPNQAIPMLPAAFYSDDIPPEDFALLEDLEFANWLAEQKEVTL